DDVAWNTDRQIGGSTTVEVAHGQSCAEVVIGSGDPDDTRRVLAKSLRTCPGEAGCRTLEQVNEPALVVLPGDADGEIGAAVTSDVARRECPPEEGAGFGVARNRG